MCLLTLRYLLLVYLNYLKYEIARRSLKGNIIIFYLWHLHLLHGLAERRFLYRWADSDILRLILIEVVVDVPFPMIAVILFFAFSLKLRRLVFVS